MRAELDISSWKKIDDSRKLESLIRLYFGPGYKFHCWCDGERKTIPVFVDEDSLEWVLAPGGSFVLGISPSEIDTALSLSSDPFLTFEEMLPAKTVEVKPFLILREPLTRKLVEKLKVTILDTIGPTEIGLFDRDVAVTLSEKYRGNIPSELEWEYSCRGGTQSLFWFGNKIPSDSELPKILGLELPSRCNGFGLYSLFHGEWCFDVWRSNYTAAPDIDKGFVVRGGAGRFWPWQDEREWSGCISAFRMPSKDTGGSGAALRLTRHMK